MPGGRGSRGQHGGYRKPAAPAPVSGPGALSQRTDGGPGQPVRPIPSGGPGATHGDRAASVELQQAAPMASSDATTAPETASPAVDASAFVDPFGPTRRPSEPVTSGAMLGPGRTPSPDGEDAEMALRHAYELTRSPYLLRLLSTFENRSTT